MNYFAVPGLYSPDTVGRAETGEPVSTSRKGVTNTDYQRAEKIIEETCNYYQIPREVLVNSKIRKRGVSRMRHICFYLIRKRTRLPYPDIGDYFKNSKGESMNHTSVMYGEAMVKDQISPKVHNVMYVREVNGIERLLNAEKKDNDEQGTT